MSNIVKFFTLTSLFVSLAGAVDIKTSKKNYDVDERIVVTVSGLPQVDDCDDSDSPKRRRDRHNDCSWIGLFKAYDISTPENLIDWDYTGDDSSATFSYKGLDKAAKYEARVFFHNTYAQEKDYYSFRVHPKHQVKLKTTKEEFKEGEPVTVTVSGLPGNSDDWLGLFYNFDESTEENIVRMIETDGQKEGTFTIPALNYDGKYEVRAFFNGTTHEERFYPFRVVDKPIEVEESPITISEVLAANAHIQVDPDFFEFSDAIELHNNSNQSIDIGGYKLSDKLNKQKWTIPENTTLAANSYMVFWADGEDTTKSAHHTNFKLKNSGEAVALFDTDNELVDSIEFGEQHMDLSCAKNQAGDIIFMNPSLGKKNRTKHDSLDDISEQPTFSKDGGFYDEGITLALNTQQNNTKIYYTTDGSIPTKRSAKYTNPIAIDKTTVVRARALTRGGFYSDATTQTYFINENSTLPVVSLSTDNKYLWDDTIGIYTIGTNGKDHCEAVANFMQDWERPAHIEFFDKEKNLGFAQEVNIKISGDCSRKRMQKSLAVEADDKYGKDTISYKLFDEKNIDEFKSFKLRNGGQDWYEAMIRDAVTQRIVKDEMNIDYQAYEPTIVFINGKYWGIHNIREKRNEDYLASNYPGLNPKKVDILYTQYTVKEGEADDYIALMEYIKNNSLAVDANYQAVSQKMDIDNFIDYQIIQIYSANFDWPVNNIRYWKEQKAGSKWRWMMDDQDATFFLFGDSHGPNYNTLEVATTVDTDEWRNPAWSTFLLRSLLQNETFKTAFINKFQNHLATTFAPTRVKAIVTDIKSAIEPEMPRHIQRWRGDGPNDPETEDMGDWNMFINKILNFADVRAAVVNQQLDDKFN